MIRYRIACVFVGVFVLAGQRTTMQSGPATVVLRAARLFDGITGRVVQPGIVVVSQGKIQAVGSQDVPAGAALVELGDATLLPGFIDSHTHLGFEFNPDYDGDTLRSMRMTIPEAAIRATANARKTLMAGFTTVRDVGAENFVDVGLRNAINAGVAPGPRMLIAVHSLGSTGGHCDSGAGFRFGLFNRETGPEDGVINSPEQARYAVRLNIKYGADVIKTCASGGVLSPTDDVDVPQLSQDELNALVDEAHTLRRKTAAHAHGAEAAKRAISSRSIPSPPWPTSSSPLRSNAAGVPDDNNGPRLLSFVRSQSSDGSILGTAVAALRASRRRIRSALSRLRLLMRSLS